MRGKCQWSASTKRGGKNTSEVQDQLRGNGKRPFQGRFTGVNSEDLGDSLLVELLMDTTNRVSVLQNAELTFDSRSFPSRGLDSTLWATS